MVWELIRRLNRATLSVFVVDDDRRSCIESVFSAVKRKFGDAVRSKTPTAMLADEIHVMEDGRILESGSHAELIARGGRYAEWGAMQNLQ